VRKPGRYNQILRVIVLGAIGIYGAFSYFKAPDSSTETSLINDKAVQRQPLGSTSVNQQRGIASVVISPDDHGKSALSVDLEVTDENFDSILNDLQNAYESLPAYERQPHEYITAQNELRFLLIFGKNHPAQQSFVIEERKFLLRKEELTTQLFEKRISVPEFIAEVNQIHQNAFLEFQRIFSDEEYVKFFGQDKRTPLPLLFSKTDPQMSAEALEAQVNDPEVLNGYIYNRSGLLVPK
jgi:hypothetical protein